MGFTSKKSLEGARIAPVFSILVSTCFSVLPGFAPAGEASFGRAQDRLLFRQKVPKPVTPRPASL
ncbi:MAG: hypothetical protein ABI618_14015, partial [Nitrospirota bacterium]